ncbi:calcium-binding protein [Paenibacillus sp. IB182496]|uniref:Calcium-binding protein n=1 Tax=Paenibacillus sabuli TaxID=2772509 RepID=A0A927GTU5_9BACL|nr:calcium-binding protein [Paenibacillus sabuli]MBD2847455.1 calcium-binding protein [Paenibacillus sabuli]
MSIVRAKDEAREEKIMMEIIVDAYDGEEQAMGWYNYLGEQLQFPFSARCKHVEAKSPLQEGEEVVVLDMSPESEYKDSMWVQIEWQGRKFAVPLAQLQSLQADESTQLAVEDWHYWVERGYFF